MTEVIDLTNAAPKRPKRSRKTRYAAPGQPSKLTEQTKTAISTALLASCNYEEAAQYAGIAPSTFYNWLNRGEAELAEGKRTQYVEFLEEVQRARARAKPRLQVLMFHHAETHPRSCFNILQTRYEDWRPKSSVQVTANVSTTNGVMEVTDDDRAFLTFMESNPAVKSAFLEFMELQSK